MITAKEEKKEVERRVPGEIIERRARKAFQMLAESQGIKLREEDYPRITFEKGDTSFFNPKEYSINIVPEHADSAVSYFEEASHALRDFVQRKRLIFKVYPFTDKTDYEKLGKLGRFLYRRLPTVGINPMVQEFYGRIGETLGRHLSQGTEFEEMFANEPARDLNDPETRSRWAKRLNQYRKTRNKIHELREKNELGRDYIKGFIRDSTQAISRMIDDYRAGNLDLEGFIRGMDKFQDAPERFYEGAERKGIKSVYKPDKEWINNFFGDISHLRESVNLALQDPEIRTSSDRNKYINDRMDFFLDMNKKIPSFYSLDPLQVPELQADLVKYSHIVHREPYQFAQQYSASELLETKGLYAMRDSATVNKFFKKRGGLEKAVETAFYFISLGFISYLLLNTKLTGAVTGISMKKISPAGEILGILFFILILVLAYFEVRKKKKLSLS